MPESRLTREFFQGPITALAFYRGADYLLAGEDTHLTLYDIKLGNAVRVASVRIFSAQPIHGIRPLTGGRVLVWGSAQVAVVSPIEAILGEGASVEDVVVKKTTAPDWIYDVSPSPYHDSSVVLATAHNEVVHLSLDEDNVPIVGAVVSPSRPILYAASLKWIDQDSVLFAGGTVFGEIVVWKCHVADGRSEMLATLSGHEGSLFGLNISDELVCQDGSAIRLLVSCSDDRTVRVWDITKQHGTTDRKQLDFAAPRETGFGSTPNGHNGSSQDAEALRPIATIMGHASRIWGVKFAELAEGDLLPQSPVTIYSFGEDSTAQRWQLNLAVSPKGLSGSLKHKETFAVHDGKHLWSHAVIRRGNETIIATGGADSKISLITQTIPSSSQAATAPTNNLTSLEFQQVLDQLPNLRTIQQHVRGREIFSRYTFLSGDKVLATSSWGRLILGTFRSNLNWTEVDIENEVIADLQSCYTMKTIGDDAVILGTTNGSLYHYRQDQGVTHIGTVPGKVFNISLLAEPSEGPMELIVHLHGTADARYLSVDWRTGAVLETADIRGMDRRFVAMSAARVKKDLIAIGSRHGFLSLLRQTEKEYRPVLNFRFNSSDAITALVPLPTTGEGAPFYFLATSRDTKYRIYEVEDLGNEVRLHLRHEVAPPFASIIEGGWFTPDASPELVLFGFKSKNFVVWNETRREEIAAVDCGGSHRTFTLAHDPTDYNRIRFGFTKTSKLCVYSQHSSIHRPLRQGTHGREIRALSSSGRYIATGAEDTTVRVWGYEEGKQGQPADKGLRCLASAKLHISGLQKTQWLGDEYLLSSAGYEEFFIWSVRRLDSRYQGLGVLCEAGLDDKSPAGDLRIVDFDACKIDGQNSIIITLAMSNSTLKTYRYTPGHGFKLLARMSYTGACLTQVRHLGVDENGLSALTASTDGHLATWKASFDDKETSSHVLVHIAPLHQSSIKSLDLQPTSEGFQVLTGGDDNALGVTTITPLSQEAGNRRYTVSSRGIVRKAHAAAINGLVLVRRGGETFGATVSNDQRIKIWRIQQDKTHLLADEYSGVADPGDIAVIDGPGSDADRNQGKLRFVVGGVGAEVWSW